MYEAVNKGCHITRTSMVYFVIYNQSWTRPLWPDINKVIQVFEDVAQDFENVSQAIEIMAQVIENEAKGWRIDNLATFETSIGWNRKVFINTHTDYRWAILLCTACASDHSSFSEKLVIACTF